MKNAHPETTRTPPRICIFTMHGDSARHPAAPKSRAWHSDRSPLHDVRHHARRPKAKACGFVFPRTSALRQAAGAVWWSQTGSNRRPPACKAGALPTELWPHSEDRPSAPSHQKVLGHQNPEDAADQHHAPAPRVGKAREPGSAPSFARSPMADLWELVGLGRFELPTSRLSSARSNQLSYKPEPGISNRKPPIRERLIAEYR